MSADISNGMGIQALFSRSSYAINGNAGPSPCPSERCAARIGHTLRHSFSRSCGHQGPRPTLCRHVTSNLDSTCTSKRTASNSDPINQTVFSWETIGKRDVFACTWVAHKTRRLLTAGIAEVARTCAGARRRRATRSRSCLRASRLVRRPHDIAPGAHLPVLL